MHRQLIIERNKRVGRLQVRASQLYCLAEDFFVWIRKTKPRTGADGEDLHSHPPSRCCYRSPAAAVEIISHGTFIYPQTKRGELRAPPEG